MVRERLHDIERTAAGIPRRIGSLVGSVQLLGRYLLLTLKQAHRDSIFLIASALAYITILSLIPLLTAFSFVGARIFNQYDERSLEIFVRILPYSEETIIHKLTEFLSQAESLRGVGLVVFLVTAFTVFVTIEETLNRVWNVHRRRPWKVRLVSFLMLLIWGPVFVGATFTSLILLRQSPGLRVLFEESLFLNLLPFLISLVGLTLLYWVVPYTSVQLRNAFAGSALAALLLELLRQGFGLWVRVAKGVNVVYGSFALALLFAISIQITWAIVLLGSEFAYSAQYFGTLSRGFDRRARLEAAWVGLAALAYLAERFTAGHPIVSPDRISAELQVPPNELDLMLQPLIDDGVLVESPGTEGGYLLGADPYRLEVERIFEAYDRRAGRAVELVHGDLRGRLQEMVARLNRARYENLAGTTLASVAGLADSPLAPRSAPG